MRRYKKLFAAIFSCLLLTGAGISGNSFAGGLSPELNAGLSGRAPSFQIQVRGTITDVDGPVSGVTVQEKNGTGSAVSGDDGSYSINVAGANATLVFTATGYVSQEMPVNGLQTVDVHLVQSFQELSNVVVTALGITRDKKSLGYSVGEVSGEEMNRVAQENVLNAIAGKVPGVVINQTGGAGSSVSMVIRGATSLSSDNQPLFVIDGVPIANSLNNVSAVGDRNRVDFGNAISSLNPDDIAEVTILKGPSAAALYGSRAGNGVVIITTKSGRNVNKLTVNVNSNTVFDIPYKFLNWQTKYGAGQFSAIPVELTGNILTNPFGNLIQEDVAGTGGGELDRGYLAVQWNSPLDENGKPIPLPLVSHKNNVRNFVQSGITTTNGVSIANRTDAVNYRLGYSNMVNRGIIPGSDLFRNSLNLGAEFKANDRLRISTNIDLSRNSSKNRPAGERGTNPLQAAYYVSPHIDIRDLADYWMPGQEGIQQRTPATGVYDNPYFMAYEVKNSFTRDRLFGNLRADWQISDKFSLMLRYGLDTYNEQREFKVPASYTREPRGAYGLIDIKSLESNADFLLTYHDKFSDFGLNVSVGGNTRNQSGYTIRNASKDGAGLIVPNVYTIQNILPTSLDYSSIHFKKGINSLYGTASFDFREMAFVDITGRNDWSSTLPHAEAFFYPSASVSLLIDQIAGINSSGINMIKLRGGVARVGNDADPYQLVSVLGNAGTWGSVPRLTTSGTLLISNLKPEIATSYEGGIDLNLFNNRFNFSATYYMVENKNQIFTTDLPSSTGYTSKKINAGLLRSKGWELAIGGAPVKTRNVRWDINVNWSRNCTRVIELAEEMPFFTFWEDAKGGAWTYLGEEVGDIYGPQIRTVTDQSSPYFGYPLLAEKDGGAKWVAIEAENTRNKIGNFNPKFLMGLQTSVSYKNWSLSFSLDWRNGGDFVSQTYRYGTEDGRSAVQFAQLFNAGSMEGKELRDYLVAHADQLIKVTGRNFPRIGWPTPEHTTYPFDFSGIKLPYGGVFIPGVVATGFDADGNPTGYSENLGENMLAADPTNPNATWPVPYATSNPWDFTQYSLFPASYLKLREVTLTFQFPEKWSSALSLQNASISIFSRNIIIWTAAKIGVDPENAYQLTSDVQGGGIQFKQGIEQYNVTPWVLPVGFKLNVTF